MMIFLARKSIEGSAGGHLNIMAGRIPPANGTATEGAPTGRYPTNLLLQGGTDLILDAQTGTQKSATARRSKGVSGSAGIALRGMGGKPVGTPDLGYGDTGGGSRYFKKI